MCYISCTFIQINKMWLSYPKLKFLILGIVVIVSLVKITTLKIDYNVKQYFPENDPDIKKYYEYVDDFGSDEQLLMIAIENEPDIFESEFLNTIKEFSDSCSVINGIKKTVSIVNLKDIIKTPLGLMPKKFMQFADTQNLTKEKHRILNDDKWKGWLFSEDGKTLVVFLETEKELSNKEKTFIIDKIKSQLKSFELHNTHLAGMIYSEVYFLEMIFYETAKSIITCALVVIIIIIILFKSFKKSLIIISTLFLGLILFYGLLGLLNQPLNLISALFPTLIVIVGVSDLIHFMTKYENEQHHFTDIKTPIIVTLKEISVTLFITSLTTIIGLLAFLTTGVKPIKEFAVLGAVGVLIAFLLAIFVLPLLIVKFQVKKTSVKKILTFWSLLMDKIYWFGKEKSIFISAGFIMVFIVSAIGISKLSLNSDLMGAVMNHSPLKKDFNYFEENLNGARVLEIAIIINDSNKITSLETLMEIEKLQNYLSSKDFIGPLISPVNSFKYINSIYHPNSDNNYQLPKTQKEADKYFKDIIAIPQIINGKLFLTDKNIARIYGKMNDIGAVKMREFINETSDWAENNIRKEIVSYQFTGSSLLMDNNNLLLVKSMTQSLLIAFAFVSLIMVLLFKSIRYVLISLIPNIFPLIFVGGILGFFFIEITGSMALIFTLGFVIAIDDTIHFLSKFRYELGKNNEPELALKNTLLTTGKAIIITSLILSVGYISIIFSESRESFFHGILISITLIVASITDLLLLPMLIRKFTKKY